MKATKLPSTRKTTENGEPIGPIRLPALNIGTVDIRLESISPLIVLRFSEKAQNQMLDKQTGEATAGKEPKNPLELFKQAAYRDDKGFLFPAVCFKAACVSCANDIEEKQTEMRRAFFVRGDVGGEFVRIMAPPITSPVTEWDSTYKQDLEWEHAHGCSMRMDPVRNASGVADLRFRAFFPVWSIQLRIDFNKNMLTLEQLLMLFTAAGFGNGVGEWRPGAKQSKTGTYGRWKIAGE